MTRPTEREQQHKHQLLVIIIIKVIIEITMAWSGAVHHSRPNNLYFPFLRAYVCFENSSLKIIDRERERRPHPPFLCARMGCFLFVLSNRGLLLAASLANTLTFTEYIALLINDTGAGFGPRGDRYNAHDSARSTASASFWLWAGRWVSSRIWVWLCQSRRIWIRFRFGLGIRNRLIQYRCVIQN